jgi:hypothetical protein
MMQLIPGDRQKDPRTAAEQWAERLLLAKVNSVPYTLPLPLDLSLRLIQAAKLAGKHPRTYAVELLDAALPMPTDPRADALTVPA